MTPEPLSESEREECTTDYCQVDELLGKLRACHRTEAKQRNDLVTLEQERDELRIEWRKINVLRGEPPECGYTICAEVSRERDELEAERDSLQLEKVALTDEIKRLKGLQHPLPLPEPPTFADVLRIAAQPVCGELWHPQYMQVALAEVERLKAALEEIAKDRSLVHGDFTQAAAIAEAAINPQQELPTCADDCGSAGSWIERGCDACDMIEDE